MAVRKPPPLGIDLGTTFSLVAYLDSSGQPQTIENPEGARLTPSVVLFEEDGVTVGKEAQKAAALEPDRFADCAKRDIGERYYHRPICGKKVPPEVVQALILQQLKADAELKIGSVERAVITVPAFFNEPRRKATQDAGALAGLDVIDIINEPTAAAVAFGWRQGLLDKTGAARKRERVLVYDLGGGTFDVTLMELKGRECRTIATGGDVHLGGIDWDRRISDHVAEVFQNRYGCDPREDQSAMRRLLGEAEEAKRALSARKTTKIAFEHKGHGLLLTLTRDEFEQMTADLLERTLFTARRVIDEAALRWKDLTRLLLVGGSTRMPSVIRALAAASGLDPDHSLSVDEAVAHGAAIYAGVLAAADQREKPAMFVQNVNSHSLGILAKDRLTGRPRNSIMISENTPLPAIKRKRFRTVKAGQRRVTVHVIEGGDPSGRNSTPIGDCVIAGLPEGLPVNSPVDVQFRYESNGRLTVRVRVESQYREASMTIHRVSGLTGEAIARWKKRLAKRSGPLRLD